MLTLLYAGPTIFGYPYPLVSENMYADHIGEPTYRMRHYSFLFQTFVLMNLFNMLNCRVLNANEVGEGALKKDFNIFTRMNKNWWFWIVLLIELNI